MRTNMSTIEISNPDTLYDPAPYGYSHIASVSGESRLVFVAGQGGEDEQGQIGTDFREQVRQAFKNVRLALEAKGLDMSHIVKMTTLIVDYDEEKHKVLIQESSKIWPQGRFPVQTLIPVPRLALSTMLFEVDAVAAKGKD
jgi:enamine deaminase RidA (YjgF/YER057c/UK114 family)